MSVPPSVSRAVRARLHAQTTQQWSEPGVIDLGIGQPQDALLPVDLVSHALAAAAGSGRRHPLQYGIEQGDGFLRVAIAEFLAAQYGRAGDADPERMLVTNGNSAALDLCCATFTRPGDVVLVEEPTYFLAQQIFRDRGLDVVGIAMDENGLRLDALEEALTRHRPALLYTIPSAHNPTGATLAEPRRRRLVELAAEHGFLVVADEVYHLLRYDGTRPASMAAHIDSGALICLDTFSKILAPGLRLGWLQAAEPLIARLATHGVLLSGGGFNPFTSAVVTDLLSDGSAAAHLDRLRAVFAGRIDGMDGALRRHLPAEVSYRRPVGGYFFWLRMPPGSAAADTTALAVRARRLGVGFQPGRACSTRGGFADHLRLSFAYYGQDELDAAVALLGRAVAEAEAVAVAGPGPGPGLGLGPGWTSGEQGPAQDKSRDTPRRSR